MKYAIETKNLTKKFENLVAVNNLNIKVKSGEIFGLLGPNGAGKTTTLLMLTTLLKPTAGTATVNGYDILRNEAKVRSSIGMVFQDPSTDDLLTGRENLYLHAMMYHVPKELRAERIAEALELADLEERADDLIRKYSGGMRRRIELVRGILHQPKILFLDEPTLGLDVQTRGHMWQYITKLAEEKEITIVLTTHYMEEADQLCDRVAIIDVGKIVALDTPENLKKKLGGDVVRLRVSNPNISALKKLPFVKEIEEKDGELLLTVSHSGKNLQRILKTAGKVEDVSLRTPTLDDVFMHYTGHEIREESPEGGFSERIMKAYSRK